MNTKPIGFIGGGRITRIFLDGWKRANALPANIVVSDCNADTLARLKARFPAINTAPGSGAAASQDIVFLAVHPPVMAEVASGIKGSLKPGALVVSLAPKFTIAKLTELLGGFARLARVIPNAPSVVNFGFNPVAFGPALTAADKAELTGLLTPLGECPEVAEEKLEAYAVLTGDGADLSVVPTSGPARSGGGLRSERGRDCPRPETHGLRRGADAARIGPDARRSDGPDSRETAGRDGAASQPRCIARGCRPFTRRSNRDKP